MAKFRSTTTTNTGTNVVNTAADLIGINIINRHNAAIFVKFYDSDVATFQDTPVYTLQVAATSPYNIPVNEENVQHSFVNGLTVRVTTSA